MNHRNYHLCLLGALGVLCLAVWLSGGPVSKQSADPSVALSLRSRHLRDQGGICTCGGGNAFGRFMYWVVGLRGTMMQFEAGFEWPSLPDHKVWGLACGLVMLRRGQRRSPALPSPRGAGARSALPLEPLLLA